MAFSDSSYVQFALKRLLGLAHTEIKSYPVGNEPNPSQVTIAGKDVYTYPIPATAGAVASAIISCVASVNPAARNPNACLEVVQDATIAPDGSGEGHPYVIKVPPEHSLSTMWNPFKATAYMSSSIVNTIITKQFGETWRPILYNSSSAEITPLNDNDWYLDERGFLIIRGTGVTPSHLGCYTYIGKTIDTLVASVSDVYSSIGPGGGGATTVTVSTSTGLGGGGTTAADLTMFMSHMSIEGLSIPYEDCILFGDVSENAVEWLSVSSGLSLEADLLNVNHTGVANAGSIGHVSLEAGLIAHSTGLTSVHTDLTTSVSGAVSTAAERLSTTGSLWVSIGNLSNTVGTFSNMFVSASSELSVFSSATNRASTLVSQSVETVRGSINALSTSVSQYQSVMLKSINTSVLLGSSISTSNLYATSASISHAVFESISTSYFFGASGSISSRFYIGSLSVGTYEGPGGGSGAATISIHAGINLSGDGTTAADMSIDSTASLSTEFARFGAASISANLFASSVSISAAYISSGFFNSLSTNSLVANQVSASLLYATANICTSATIYGGHISCSTYSWPVGGGGGYPTYVHLGGTCVTANVADSMSIAFNNAIFSATADSGNAMSIFIKNPATFGSVSVSGKLVATSANLAYLDGNFAEITSVSVGSYLEAPAALVSAMGVGCVGWSVNHGLYVGYNSITHSAGFHGIFCYPKFQPEEIASVQWVGLGGYAGLNNQSIGGQAYGLRFGVGGLGGSGGYSKSLSVFGAALFGAFKPWGGCFLATDVIGMYVQSMFLQGADSEARNAYGAFIDNPYLGSGITACSVTCSTHTHLRICHTVSAGGADNYQVRLDGAGAGQGIFLNMSNSNNFARVYQSSSNNLIFKIAGTSGVSSLSLASTTCQIIAMSQSAIAFFDRVGLTCPLSISLDSSAAYNSAHVLKITQSVDSTASIRTYIQSVANFVGTMAQWLCSVGIFRST